MKVSTIIRMVAVAAAGVIGTAAAWAQGTPAVAGKVGVINVRQAIVSTAEGKLASAELQSQFSSRQNELEGLNKQINDIRQRLSATAVLSDEEKARLTTQGQRLTTQLERKQTEYQEDLNAAQGEVIDRIGRKMLDVLERYARENGYTIVLDTSAQNTPILFAANSIDLTQDILHLYDQAYPIKAGAATTTTPKPAAPKPAAQPPAGQQKPPAAQQKPPQQ